MNNQETEATELVISEQSAPSRSDYDFKLTEPGNMSLANIVALSKLASRGGMSDPKGAEGLAIRAVFGVQMGFTPVEGMQGLYLIEGKPVVGAQLLSKRVKESPKYDYRVIEHSNKKCEIEGFEIVDGRRESLGKASFTIEQAAAAGLAGRQVWKAYPENMLFARAMANLHRWHMPDLIGSPFYTEGEDIVSEEPSIAVSTATKAMEAASKRVSKQPVKAEAVGQPDPEVIPAEFVEEPAAVETVEVGDPTGGTVAVVDDTPKAETKPVHVTVPDTEDDVNDPFDWIWQGEHVGLRSTTIKDRPAFEVYVVATGKSLPNAAGTNQDSMMEIADKIEAYWNKPDDDLRKVKGSVDEKIAKVILDNRPASEPMEQQVGEPSIADVAAESDGEYEAIANALRGEIGDDSFAKLAAYTADKKCDFASFVSSETLADARSTEKYMSSNEMGRFSLANMALLKWMRENKG